MSTQQIEYCPRCHKDRVATVRELSTGKHWWRTTYCNDCRTILSDVNIDDEKAGCRCSGGLEEKQ